jgi:putative flippase GtrA
MKIADRIDEILGRLLQEVAKFGVVGLIGVFVNVALFNLCRVVFDLAPVRSSIIATLVAMVVTYLGNCHWTYRDREQVKHSSAVALFLVFNVIGMGIQSGALAISHYALDMRTLVADNISYNFIGLGLATLFRFWAYRKWVFPETQPVITDLDLPETVMAEAEIDAEIEAAEIDAQLLEIERNELDLDHETATLVASHSGARQAS